MSKSAIKDFLNNKNIEHKKTLLKKGKTERVNCFERHSATNCFRKKDKLIQSF